MTNEEALKLQFTSKVISSKITQNIEYIKQYIASVIKRGHILIAYNNIKLIDDNGLLPDEKKECLKRIINKRTILYKI